jgi:hypothetical protein
MEGTLSDPIRLAIRLAEMEAELQRTREQIVELQKAIERLATLVGLTLESIGLSSKEKP